MVLQMTSRRSPCNDDLVFVIRDSRINCRGRNALKTQTKADVCSFTTLTFIISLFSTLPEVFPDKVEVDLLRSFHFNPAYMYL